MHIYVNWSAKLFLNDCDVSLCQIEAVTKVIITHTFPTLRSTLAETTVIK